MAIVRVAHRPNLSPERAMYAFNRNFHREYKIYKSGVLMRDFVVKKNAWTGVGVKLKQEDNGTSFVFTAMMPSIILNILFGGVIAFLFLRPSWRAMERDVGAFIESAADFK
ncbi:MAG: hypothetical protein BZY87_00100 [SAR202 cluster bacterium Io17-Chloro-G6]|nr:MAG: hypothetical protein BZY87_00100 [SAR202 cluster bacterium Io17-Chloro-G6]